MQIHRLYLLRGECKPNAVDNMYQQLSLYISVLVIKWNMYYIASQVHIVNTIVFGKALAQHHHHYRYGCVCV